MNIQCTEYNNNNNTADCAITGKYFCITNCKIENLSLVHGRVETLKEIKFPL